MGKWQKRTRVMIFEYRDVNHSAFKTFEGFRSTFCKKASITLPSYMKYFKEGETFTLPKKMKMGLAVREAWIVRESYNERA